MGASPGAGLVAALPGDCCGLAETRPGRPSGAAEGGGMTGGARLRVSAIACDGRGLCAEAFPEMITLDDWGFPIIRDHDVPPGLWPAAEEAIRLCPQLALRLARQRMAEDLAVRAAGFPALAGQPKSGRTSHR